MNAVIVTGDRHAKHALWSPVIERVLVDLTGDGLVVVIQGWADGIDTWAEGIASSHRMMAPLPMRAQWERYGPSAGPKRNAAMRSVLLTLGEHGYDTKVLAFHDRLNESKGTKDMVIRAVRAGVETWHFTSYGPSRQIAQVEGGKV